MLLWIEPHWIEFQCTKFTLAIISLSKHWGCQTVSNPMCRKDIRQNFLSDNTPHMPALWLFTNQYWRWRVNENYWHTTATKSLFYYLFCILSLFDSQPHFKLWNQKWFFKLSNQKVTATTTIIMTMNWEVVSCSGDWNIYKCVLICENCHLQTSHSHGCYHFQHTKPMHMSVGLLYGLLHNESMVRDFILFWGKSMCMCVNVFVVI